jgi:GxxExxY protein
MGYEPDAATGLVIGCAIEVHKALGPGLLESVYQRCLTQELGARGVSFAQQVRLPIVYKGTPVDCSYRLDLVIEGRLIVEVKCVDRLLPIHDAQLLTYLKLSEATRGLLINFNVAWLVDGIRSLVR